MSEILPHRRTKGPASSPAMRLVELQQALIHESGLLAEERRLNTQLHSELSRYKRIGGVSFGGIAAAQFWADFILWESILNDRRYEAIIELGTWQGGFAWWLWAQCQVRDMFFLTVDTIDPPKPPPGFRRCDVFIETESIGAVIREHEPCVVLCDNGNKPRELTTFANEIRDPNSLLVVHDWGTEIQPEDVPDTVTMVYEDFCKELGSISRVFRKRR